MRSYENIDKPDGVKGNCDKERILLVVKMKCCEYI
jgi:hypothetical protein